MARPLLTILLLLFAPLVELKQVNYQLLKDLIHKSLLPRSDIKIQSVVIFTEEEQVDSDIQDWNLTEDLTLVVATRSTAEVEQLSMLRSLVLVADPGLSDIYLPLLLQFSEKSIWYIPEEDESAIPVQSLRLTSFVNLYKYAADKAEFFELYQVKDNIFRTPRGFWSPETGPNMDDTFTWQRRQNLEATHFKAVVEQNTPSSMLEFDIQGNVVELTGTYPEIFQVLQNKLNFTYDMFVSADRKWGNIIDGKFTGMVKILIDKEADISPVQYSNTATRFPHIDVTAYVVVEKLKLYMRKPASSFTAKMGAYFSDFEATIWLVFFVTFGVLSMVYYATHFLHIAQYHPEEEEKFGFLNSFGVIGMSLLQKDYPLKTDTMFSRLLYFTTISSAFVLFEVYSASLTSVFTADSYTPSINDLSDIVEQNYQVCVWSGTSSEQYFKGAPVGTVQNELWETVVSGTENQVPSLQAGLERVLTEEKMLFLGYYFGSRGLFNSELSYAKCTFIELPKVYQMYNSGFALQKDSELTPLINFHLAKLREQGQVSHLVLKYMPVHNPSTCARSGPTQMQFASVISLFTLLAFGCTVAAGLVILERVKRATAGMCVKESKKGVIRKKEMNMLNETFEMYKNVDN